MKRLVAFLVLFNLCFVNTEAKVSVKITKNNDLIDDVLEVTAIGAICAVATGALVGLGTLIAKGVKNLYSAESYYDSARKLFDNNVDFVVKTPCETPFELEVLVLQRNYGMNYFWDINTSDCYLYSAYRKLVDIKCGLEKALEYIEIAHGKDPIVLPHRGVQDEKAYKLSRDIINLRVQIREVHDEIQRKIQLCQLHPLYETHTNIYLKKRELEQEKWRIRQMEIQAEAMKKQTKELKKERKELKKQRKAEEKLQQAPHIDIRIVQ